MTITYPPGTPNWVDLGTTDMTAATTFYGALFGWTVESLGPAAGNYGIIRKDGRQVAGIAPATDPDRGTSWAVYFATDNADATTATVESRGGTVVTAPMDIMDQGRMAVFADPTGAYFSVWQPGKHTGMELVQTHGSLTWAELMTTDIETAKAFYSAVLPVTGRDVKVDDGGTYTLLEVDGTGVAGAMEIGPDMGPMRSAWSVYFAVDDCDAIADRALELGGTELTRMDSPAGRLAMLVDPQGGSFGIIKPNPDFSM